MTRPAVPPLRAAQRLLAAGSVTLLAAAAVAVAAAAPAGAAITPAAGTPLIAAHSGKCLNVDGASLANEAAVIQYTCFPSMLNDKWRAVPMGDGTYHLIAIHSGKCLNVSKASLLNSAAVIQYTCSTSGKNDRWRPRAVPRTQKFQLVAEHSGKCLNVSGASLLNEAAIIQYTCTTSSSTYTNDHWYFPPATATPPAAAITPDTPVTATQASPASGATVGGLAYAYVDNIGRLLYGHQPDPANFGGVQWTVLSGLEAFSGQPGLAEQADGRMQILAHNTDGDAWVRTQVSQTSTSWYNWQDVAGSSPRHPAVGRMPDGKRVNFVVAADGRLWAQPQDGV
ncbi:MAG TPA: RICIN domain-containing protein, partial [Micromonospora sp.]